MLGGHGVNVLGNQDPALGGCPGENLTVRPSSEADFRDSAHVNLRIGSPEASKDPMIHILVEEQSQRGHGRAARESASRDRRSALRVRAASRRREVSDS